MPELDPATLAAARRAGWRTIELRWELLQEAAHAAHGAGDIPEAAALWRRAARIAIWLFARGDPRIATSLANKGFSRHLSGGDPTRLYRLAALKWADVPRWVERMRIGRRARSSLFHLRMEARHADAFQENFLKRYRAFTKEAQIRLEALRDGRPVAKAPVLRWKGEKPPVFDDTRRLLGACLLIAVPLPPSP